MQSFDDERTRQLALRGHDFFFHPEFLFSSGAAAAVVLLCALFCALFRFVAVCLCVTGFCHSYSLRAPCPSVSPCRVFFPPQFAAGAFAFFFALRCAGF